MRRLVVICALFLFGCTKNSDDSNKASPVPPPEPPAAPKRIGPTIFDSSDQVLQLLQGRVKSQLQGSDDFVVQPVGAFVYPIGTLMPEGRSIAKNRNACAPPKDSVGTYGMPNMYNSIAMTGKVAVELGLGQIISELADAGFKVGQGDTFEIGVKNAKGQFLLDDELDDLLNQGSCKAYLSGRTMNLVRGYVIGQRSYLLGRDRTASGDVGLTKIGGVKFEGAKGSKASLVDDQPVEFLAIVSKVSLPTTSPAAGPAAAVPQVSAPTAPAGQGKAYIQRDVRDNSDAAGRVQKLLAGLSLEVVPKVEPVDSRKMPRKAEVRYFNKEDEALAGHTANALREIYPNAIKLYVGLKAPPRQLEVWLPKAGG